MILNDFLGPFEIIFRLIEAKNIELVIHWMPRVIHWMPTQMEGHETNSSEHQRRAHWGIHVVWGDEKIMALKPLENFADAYPLAVGARRSLTRNHFTPTCRSFFSISDTTPIPGTNFPPKKRKTVPPQKTATKQSENMPRPYVLKGLRGKQ